MQQQPVVRVLEVLPRRVRDEGLFDRERRTTGGESGAVGDAEDVGIHCHFHLAEHHVEHDAGGLAPDTGQGFQGGTLGRNLAAVALFGWRGLILWKVALPMAAALSRDDARARAVACCSHDTMTSQYEDLYREVAA